MFEIIKKVDDNYIIFDSSSRKQDLVTIGCIVESQKSIAELITATAKRALIEYV